MATFASSIAICRQRFGLQRFRVQPLSNLSIPKLKGDTRKKKDKNSQPNRRLEGDSAALFALPKQQNNPYELSENRSKGHGLGLKESHWRSRRSNTGLYNDNGFYKWRDTVTNDDGFCGMDVTFLGELLLLFCRIRG